MRCRTGTPPLPAWPHIFSIGLASYTRDGLAYARARSPLSVVTILDQNTLPPAAWLLPRPSSMPLLYALPHASRAPRYGAPIMDLQ